ncbi:hypothetical protein [Pseudonocardia alaniniphila]|uniref:ESAT-6 protein secretion system EspG family protein n=1 Tax=Pseudonocardia alaniniphila TaxID=75291 RepID=A0ABS9T6K6_9PSEU|nr:hypothetical protein [Pseudonocardia alaniniphila]MCH6164163.1 hypothetical protein [Pseudonocardia alaniniphila]
MDTATVIANAMTDYLLASGTGTAPATRAPAHMAAWLDARGYRLVRPPAPHPSEQDDGNEFARIASSIDWHSADITDEAKGEIVRQVIDAVTTAATVSTDKRQSAPLGARHPSPFRPTIVRSTTAGTEHDAEPAESPSGYTQVNARSATAQPCSIELYGSRRESVTLRSVPATSPGPARAQTPLRASVELPDPIRPAGYAERDPYKVTWAGGVHLLGARILVIPCRTVNSPDEARAHAAAVLAAAARMQR